MESKTIIMYLILAVCLLAVLGCSTGNAQSKYIYSCKTDSDCVPKPGCHPIECINQKYEKLFEKPEACTLIFMSEAAYTNEDCACIEGLCANKNLLSETKDYTEEESLEIASEYIQQSSTYKFDGSNLQFKKSTVLRCPQCWDFLFEFQCSHPGYGDRSGQVLAQVITPHITLISVAKGKISTAILDNTWDMIKQDTIEIPDEVPGEDIPTEEGTASYCASDSDCACGRHIITGDCFYGNADYVDTSRQCPDFCTGIAANLQLKCITNRCQQVPK